MPGARAAMQPMLCVLFMSLHWCPIYGIAAVVSRWQWWAKVQ